MLGSAVLWGVGDAMVQRKTQVRKFKWRRTARHAVFGGLFVSPLGETWYRAIDRHVSRKFPCGTPSFVLYKILLDTCLWNPIFTTGYMCFTSDKLTETLSSKYVNTLLFECAYWPPFDYVNFKFVPVPHQTLFMNSVSLLDTLYLSSSVQE